MWRSLVRIVCTFLSYFFVLAFTVCTPPASAAEAEQSATAGTADQTDLFPISISPTKRYLQDALGRPFLIHGDTAWSLIAELTRDEVELYLSDRKSRGFNTLVVSLIEHRFSTNAPANAYGQLPFNTEGHFSDPNDRYFNHADWVLRRARELGFLLLLAPAYMGYGGGDEGWYEKMLASGAGKLRAYGRYIGKRYASYDNIIWLHAGDHNPSDKNLVRAIVDGIVDTAPSTLHTAHCAPETAALDYWDGESWLALNNIYTYGRVLPAAWRQNRRSPRMPFILIESAYENEHGVTEQRLRMQAFDAILGGAAGHVFGNNPIWHFDGPGIYPSPLDWKDALDSAGAKSMQHFQKLMNGLAWWTLQPAQRLIVNNRNQSYWSKFQRWLSSNADKRAVGAVAEDGSLAVIYLPSARSIEINLALLSSTNVTADWYDPTDGSYLSTETELHPNGTQVFTSPERNSAGFSDWVLLLRSQR